MICSLLQDERQIGPPNMSLREGTFVHLPKLNTAAKIYTPKPASQTGAPSRSTILTRLQVLTILYPFKEYSVYYLTYIASCIASSVHYFSYFHDENNLTSNKSLGQTASSGRNLRVEIVVFHRKWGWNG